MKIQFLLISILLSALSVRAATVEERLALLEREVSNLKARPTIANLLRKVNSPDANACPAGGYKHSLYADMDKSGTVTAPDIEVYKFHACNKGYYLDGMVNTVSGWYPQSNLGCYHAYCFDISSIFGPNKILAMGKAMGPFSKIYFEKINCSGQAYLKKTDVFFPAYEVDGKTMFISASPNASYVSIKVLSVLDYEPGKSKDQACRPPTAEELKFPTAQAAYYDGSIIDPNAKIKDDEGGVRWY